MKRMRCAGRGTDKGVPSNQKDFKNWTPLLCDRKIGQLALVTAAINTSQGTRFVWCLLGDVRQLLDVLHAGQPFRCSVSFA
jgi:hypothetical protein